MTTTEKLTPAAELAAKNDAHFPNESEAYRKARNALLAEEIELRRHLWRVAEQRRRLPPDVVFGDAVGHVYGDTGSNSDNFAGNMLADRRLRTCFRPE